jgi:hypothetical protein
MHTRYRHLSARIGVHKALTAIARELAGFIWAAGQLLAKVPQQHDLQRVDDAGRGRAGRDCRVPS